MRIIISLLAGFVFAVQALAQATVVYSYDPAGNRTQRDTTSTNIVLSPSADGGVTLADRNATLAANIGLPSRSTFGEDVISEEGTSPRVNVWPGVMGKIKPIESHLPQQYSYIDDYCGKGSPHYVFLTVFRSFLTNEKNISTSFEK